MEHTPNNWNVGQPDPSDGSPETWNWLSPKLSLRLESIRDKVLHILDEHNQAAKVGQLQHYTPHGREHFEAVENLIHRLLLGQRVGPLTDNERFFLLGSAWLHDLGMIRGIFPNDAKLSDYEIRADHHNRSARFIQEERARLGIDSVEADVFAVLAIYHRRRCPLSDCDEKTFFNHQDIRLRLLAAYLRLADALDIDYTRASDVKYAISLTYDIPRASKIHWLRSRFVLSVDISHEMRRLIVHLRTPLQTGSDEENKTIDSIFDTIIQDLQEELDSVKNVLLLYGYSYFLEVKQERQKVPFDARFRSDIKSVLNYYFLMENPSSSALSRLLLESLKGIVDSDPHDLKQEVKAFLQEVEQNVLRTRACHVGLRRLANEVHKKIDNDAQIAPKGLMDWTQEQLNLLHSRRSRLRENAAEYLTQNNPICPPQFNILLYGYSELAIKALCGFRDSVETRLDAKIGRAPNPTSREDRASKCFTIFVCEGQPKNHTAWGGRVAYHDGARYAQSLNRRGFSNICIIPDAAAGTLLLHLDQGMPYVDYIIIGANGFDDNSFVHSAGHAMIASLKDLAAQVATKRHDGGSAPKLVLATLTDKFSAAGPADNVTAEAKTPDSIRDGWLFKGSFGNERVRLQPFFAQDERLHDALWACKPPISFYNPREDHISIRSIDVAITEERWFVQGADSNKPWNGSLIASRPGVRTTAAESERR